MFLEVQQEVWVPSSCHGDLREPLILVLGSQDSFGVVRGLSGFLSRHCSGKGIISIEGRITWYFLSCGGKLGVPLELRRVLRDCSCCLREVRSLFELRGAGRDSSRVGAGARASCRVEAGNSGFLSSSDMDLGVPMEIPLGSQTSLILKHGTALPSRCVKGVSGLLSS